MMPWFNARKAAQVAAYFISCEAGGRMNILKLVKLIYLADRKSLDLYNFSITGDNFVSMDHGPVNSITFDYINGCELDRDGWEEFILDRDHYDVGLQKENITDKDLDELSRAELKVLRQTWEEFGGMNKFQIRDWTHNNCPEWEDPKGTSEAIPYARILKFLNKENADHLADQILAEREIERAFVE